MSPFGLPRGWLSRLLAWGALHPRRLGGGARRVWVEPPMPERMPTPPGDPVLGAGLEYLARESHRQAEACLERLAVRTPSGVAMMGVLQADTGAVLDCLAAWRGQPPRPAYAKGRLWLLQADGPESDSTPFAVPAGWESPRIFKE